MLVTEIANYATGQTCRRAMEGAGEAGVGWYLFELTIGEDLFGEVQGIFYPDGSVRSLSEAAAVAGFREKPMGKGIRTLYAFDPEDFTDLSIEAAATEWNIERKLRLLLSMNARNLVEQLVRDERSNEDERPDDPAAADPEAVGRKPADIRKAAVERSKELWEPAWDLFTAGNTAEACSRTDDAVAVLADLARKYVTKFVVED